MNLTRSSCLLLFYYQERSETMEKIVSAKPIGVVMICDICGNGELRYIEHSDFKREDQLFFQHKCNNCCTEKWLKTKYPFIKYEFDY